MLADLRRRLLDWLSFKVGWRWGWRRHYIEMPESIWLSGEAKDFVAEMMPGRIRGFGFHGAGTLLVSRFVASYLQFQTEVDKVTFALRFSEEIRTEQRHRREAAAHVEAVLASLPNCREDGNEVYHARRTQAGLAE